MPLKNPLFTGINEGKQGFTTPEFFRMTWECPRRLGPGTLNSILGKLGSILSRLGGLDIANRIVHPRVKEYLRLVREEKAGVAVSP